MGLQFIFGASGAGKSHYIYHKIIEESMEHPEQQYIILVPEQFTMQTQKQLVTMHPRKGIMNIDVLSFERLALRVREELGETGRELLEETGKSMVLRKVAQEKKKELKLLGSKMNKQGYVAQMKSMVSELRQYEITPEDLEELLEGLEDKPQLYHKLRDIKVLYQGFFEHLEGKYITQEEVLDVFAKIACRSRKLQGSTLVLDGYTGFTPIQMQAMEQLLLLCRQVYVTITIGEGEDPFRLGSPHQLFYLSKQTVGKLCKIARESGVPFGQTWVPEQGGRYQGRFRDNPALAFLEKNLFRYGRKSCADERKAVHIRESLNPGTEMEETACLIHRMVRKEGYRYGDLAVITGDMEVYAPAASRAFEAYGIPCFIDQKHSLFFNPFVEYIRSAVNMVVENFSYESVFRLLRCGLSDVARSEIDVLENYVVAEGIRGLAAWKEEWVRPYRGQEPGELIRLNQTREKLVDMWEPFVDIMKDPKARVEDHARALYGYICADHIERKLKEHEKEFQEQGKTALSREYAQIYRIVMDLLDKLVDVLGEERVGARAFQEILEAGLSEAKVGVVPPASDQVLVGDMERTRLKDVKILFFVGVNEGKLPKDSRGGKLLSDQNREELAVPLKERGLALAPTAREELYTQKFYLYINLTKPSKRVYVSYSRLSQSGEALLPSYLVSQIQRLFPRAARAEEIPLDRENIEGALSRVARDLGKREEKTPLFQELYSWFFRHPQWNSCLRTLVKAAYHVNPKDSIGKEAAQALYGIELENSATRLEQFARCACSHFLLYGLTLKERVRYEFSMADLGSLLHASLDLFAKRLGEQGLSWNDLEDELRDKMAEDCVDQVVSQSGQTVLWANARNAHTVDRAKRMVKKSVWALQQQLRQGSFTPALTEWGFGPWDHIRALDIPLSSGQRLSLTGRIDRIDVCQEGDQVYVKVIDYKSGNTKLDMVKLYHGLQLQLGLYLGAALELEQRRFPEKEVRPAGIFYYHIKDPVLDREDVKDPEHPGPDILKKLKMDGIAGAEPDILTKLDKSLSAGKSVESMTIPVKFTAKGTLASGSKVADQEQFSRLTCYVHEKIRQIGQEILAGKVQADPYGYQKENACGYCPYRNICGFDEKLPGYAYRRLPDMDQDQVWEKMREALEKDRTGEEE